MEMCASPFCGNMATKQLHKVIFKMENGVPVVHSIEYQLCDYHYEMATEVWP